MVGSEALLSNEEVIFKFDGIESKVRFKNLEYYKIEYGNGVSLNLKMLSTAITGVIVSRECQSEFLKTAVRILYGSWINQGVCATL